MPHEPLTPEQRSLRSRIGAYASWSHTADPSARTAPARAASMARFEREVDPDGTLTEAERTRRAEHAKRAYFATLALKSVRSRTKAAAVRRRAAERDAEARRQADALDAEALAAAAELDESGGDAA